MRILEVSLAALAIFLDTNYHAFAFVPTQTTSSGTPARTSSLQSTAALTSTTQVEASVNQLKKVLTREYTSFFDPMEKQFYKPDVTFQDPLTSLSSVDAYQNNVDMLAGRNLVGSLLFSDASINLHSVTGGEVSVNGDKVSISDIQTRWTLRFCFKALPWKPTARFSGISVYGVNAGGSEGVLVTRQDDYWDSINLQSDGSYKAADRSVGLADLIDQLKPSDFEAAAAAPEVPYELLRRGRGYEIRRYPAITAAKHAYERRDEGFSILGAFTSGMNPLGPAIMKVQPGGEKTMMWPLSFAAPGAEAAFPSNAEATASVELVKIPARVVAVARFSDASIEPVVRKATLELRESCKRDALVLADDDDQVLQFCQYDAIFSMGKRRGEVWLPLKDADHPWVN